MIDNACKSVLLAVSCCLPIHDYSMVDTPIYNQSIMSFSTVAMHFPNAYKLIRIKLKKDVHKYEKT